MINKTKILYLSLTIFMFVVLQSQTIVRDTIEINPKSIHLPLAPAEINSIESSQSNHFFSAHYMPTNQGHVPAIYWDIKYWGSGLAKIPAFANITWNITIINIDENEKEPVLLLIKYPWDYPWSLETYERKKLLPYNTVTLRGSREIVFYKPPVWTFAVRCNWCGNWTYPQSVEVNSTGDTAIFTFCRLTDYAHIEGTVLVAAYGEEDEEHSILLGETKYYYATEKDGKIIIKETGTPVLGEGGVSTATFDEPVAAEGSEKNPVYWEYRNKDGNPLDPGIIRLIGRYWEEGKTFKTTLTANVNGQKGSIDVEVKKPKQLGGDEGNAKARRFYWDIDGALINIDELCIKYGGQIGVPPQFIKGQIHNECAYNKELDVLVPSYRFEPYTTAWDIYRKGLYKSSLYYIRSSTDAQMGSGLCVPSGSCQPEHQYVSALPYVLYPKSLWDFIYDYSEIETAEPPTGREPPITSGQHKIFGKRTEEGEMDFGPYTTLQEWYDASYNAYYSDDPLSAAEKARQEVAQGLRHALSSAVAQTRIASSYGFLQTLYTTAIGREIGYPKANRPEDINIASVCELYQFRHLKNVVNEQIKKILQNSAGEWSMGFEQFFIKYVYPKWNPGDPEYPQRTINFSSFYIPQ